MTDVSFPNEKLQNIVFPDLHGNKDVPAFLVNGQKLFFTIDSLIGEVSDDKFSRMAVIVNPPPYYLVAPDKKWGRLFSQIVNRYPERSAIYLPVDELSVLARNFHHDYFTLRFSRAKYIMGDTEVKTSHALLLNERIILVS